MALHEELRDEPLETRASTDREARGQARGAQDGAGQDGDSGQEAHQEAGQEARQEGGQTEGRSARSLSFHALRTIYLDLLGRPPFDAERERWAGRDRGDLLDAILGSEEYWGHWYEEQLYYFLLIDNFRPATEGLSTLHAKLSEGRISIRDALHRIALSPTFDMRNPGADTFVTVVMEQIAGMTVQKNRRELEIGKALYDGGDGQFLGRRGNGQADVVEIAVNSKQATKAFVEREYERLVRRAPDKKTVNADTRTLHKDPHACLELVRSWMLSESYDRRLANPVVIPNRIFVRALFVDLLGRLPSSDESRPMRNALDGLSDSRPLRSVLVRLLLDSGKVPVPHEDEIGDATHWVIGLFRRLLGREGTPDELAAFVGALQGPDCDTRTILYALLSAAEYHSY